MICKRCGAENPDAKRVCTECGAFLEGYTFNNVTGDYGYRGADGGWYKTEEDYIENKKKQLIMAKSEDERLWGVSLSMASRELPMTLSVINQVCQQINMRCNQLGKENLKSTPEGLRLTHLLTMVGGLKYMMEGVDGVLNALVLDLLKEFREEYTDGQTPKNQ